MSLAQINNFSLHERFEDDRRRALGALEIAMLTTPPDEGRVRAVLAFLEGELGMDAAARAKAVRAFPELLGCSDAQLAAVLGHEVGHVIAHHGAEEIAAGEHDSVGPEVRGELVLGVVELDENFRGRIEPPHARDDVGLREKVAETQGGRFIHVGPRY